MWIGIKGRHFLIYLIIFELKSHTYRPNTGDLRNKYLQSCRSAINLAVIKAKTRIKCTIVC